ncbi:hypothetical protein HDV06_001203 [Boothiomyces sp. JEL0866]|nr:hypothetical protein HDV06_001203 [Boothiomyces sp. JEL0866]
MQIVVITGCSEGGIGHYLAQSFLDSGCIVYPTARRLESMEPLNQKNSFPTKLDVNNPENVKQVIDEIIRVQGRIDIFVNNAGVGCVGALVDVPIDTIRSVFETNVFSIVAITKVIAPIMAKQGGGKILNVGSIVGDISTPFGSVYSSTKAAIGMISDGLKMELEPFNVQVCLVQPGAIKSNFGKNASGNMSLPNENSLFWPYKKNIEARAVASQGFNSTPTKEFADATVKVALRKNLPKRKCDRQNPCSNCLKIKEECRYSGAKFRIQESKTEFEDRILYLESMLFNQHLDDMDTTQFYSKPVDGIPAPKELSNEIQEFLFKDRPEMMQILSLEWLDIDASFLSVCAQNSMAVNYLLYAFSALEAPSRCLAYGMTNHETARAYIEKAETFVNNAISDYSLNAIVIFILLSVSYYRIREEPKAVYYLNLAVLQAKEFGINNEATISNLTLFDYERGVYRKLWWTIYEYDVYLGVNKISEISNFLYLPFPEGVSELDSEDSDFGMQIMNSSDWFTPGFQNQSILAYKVLLTRIHHKITKYETSEYRKKGSLDRFVMMALESSLDIWNQSLPEMITNSIGLHNFQYRSINTLHSDTAEYPSIDQMTLLDPKLLYLQLYFNYLNIYIRLLRISQLYKVLQIQPLVEYQEALEFARNSQIWIELQIKNSKDVALQSPFFCNIILLSSIPLIIEGKLISTTPYMAMRQVLNTFTNEHDNFASDIFDMLASAKDVPDLFAVYFEIKNAKQL